MTSPTPSSTPVIGPARDPQGFERFYLAHVDAVMRYAVSRSGSAHDAADLVTLVFVRAIEHADSFDPAKGTPRQWLMGICANAAVDQYRRTAREVRLVQRLRHEVPLTTDDVDRIESRIDAERLGGQVYDAIADLPASQQEVVDLVDRHGMSIRDAAHLLGVSRTAVRVRLSRARSTLRSTLPDQSAPDPRRGP